MISEELEILSYLAEIFTRKYWPCRTKKIPEQRWLKQITYFRKHKLTNHHLQTIKKETYILPITITNDNIKLFKKTKNKLLKPIMIYEDSYKKNSELSENFINIKDLEANN